MTNRAAFHRTLGALAVGAFVGLTTLGGISSTWAQEDDFAEADRNHDGRVDRGEYEKRMIEVFYLADTNKDGVLEIDEVVVSERATFAAADSNKDGKVTWREFLVVRMADFDAADTNHDGVLSGEEVEAWSVSH